MWPIERAGARCLRLILSLIFVGVDYGNFLKDNLNF